jgi:hypothetical protein
MDNTNKAFSRWFKQFNKNYKIITIMIPASMYSKIPLSLTNVSKNSLTFFDSEMILASSKMCYMIKDKKGVYFNAL